MKVTMIETHTFSLIVIIVACAIEHTDAQSDCNTPLRNSVVMSKVASTYNKVLRATVVSTTPLVNLVVCSGSCTSQPTCVYVGLNTVAKTCTLLAAAGGPAQTFASFTDVYLAESRVSQYSSQCLQQQPCVSNPCLNGATCQSYGTPPTFNCTCAPSYTGPLCQTALNTTLYVAADDGAVVYVDGIQVVSCPDIFTVYSANISQASSLIAVQLYNAAGYSDFTMSLGYGGCVTNTSAWRCTGTLYPSWDSLNYNDRAWPLAVRYRTYGVNYHCATCFEVFSTCPCINSANYNNKVGYTYCRLWLN